MFFFPLLLLIPLAFSQSHKYDQCNQLQKCTDPNDSTTCGIPQISWRNATKLNTQEEQVCAEFKDMDVCCNEDQNIVLKNNFLLISYMFGNPGGGCDVCYTNIKRFWCHYTCSNRQSKFVYPDKVINYTMDGVTYEVLNVTFYVHPKLACEIYNSCSKTQKVSLTSALQSSMGLLNFQGQQSVGQGKTLINIKYIDKPQDGFEPLMFRTDQCNATFPNKTNKEGYIIENTCSCNNCQNMCSNTFDFSQASNPMEGFQIWLVVPLYLSLIVVTMIIIYLRKYFKKQNKKSRSVDNQRQYLERLVQQS